MTQVIEFVKTNDLKKTQVYEKLNLNHQKALILQHLTKQFLIGEVEFNVCNILMEIFGKEDYVYLDNVKYIQELIDEGWIIYGALNSINSDNSLEILNSSITLSTAFLNFLEFGQKKNTLNEEIIPYADHLEYLKDQFSRIDLYQSMAQNKSSIMGFNTQKIKEKIDKLEQKIKKRIKITQKPLHVEELIKENELNEKECIIFLALLKEEYTGDLDSMRELNSLIALVSNDNYEKIKNRILLEEDSTLIESGLLDYEEMITGFGGISRNFYISEDILQRIMYPNKNKKVKKLKLDMIVQNQDIFELINPTTSLDDVVMHPKTRELMDNLLKQVDKNVIARLKKWGIKKNRRGIDAKILLYGPPGTGKTMTATSLAKSLKKRILSFDCSKILSKYVGESEQNVRRIFDTYKDICQQTKSEPILLLNEADQFLSSRMEATSGGADKMHNQMQNIFLEQIERFEGILVATTNFLESLDVAFSRRFDYKIEFKRPDFNQRLDLWRRVLPEEAIYEESFDIDQLANYPLSGGQIVVVLKNTALKVAVKQEPIFTMQDFIQTIQRETSGAFGETKSMGFAN